PRRLDRLDDDAGAGERAHAVLDDDDLALADRLETGRGRALARAAAVHHPPHLVEAVGVDDVVVELLVLRVDDEGEIVEQREVLIGFEHVGENRLAVDLDELLREEAAGETAAAAAGEDDRAHAAGSLRSLACAGLRADSWIELHGHWLGTPQRRRNRDR